MINWDALRTPESEAREAARSQARAYLSDTDWMVTRRAETGKPIPEEVAIRRAEAREALNG